MMWKLVFFSQNIWVGQIGLGTLIFGQFLHFDNLQPFTYLWEKFPAWGSWHENWSFSTERVNFEWVKLIQEPEFWVRFCIFLSRKNIPADDKKCEPEAYAMKRNLFSRYLFGLCRLCKP